VSRRRPGKHRLKTEMMKEYVRLRPRCVCCGVLLDYAADAACSPCESILDSGLSIRAVAGLPGTSRRRALKNASHRRRP
jgi:hypothetical protein